MWKVLALSAGIVALATSTATAQPKCDARDSVVKHLASKYKENPVAIGVTNSGGLVEVLSTKNGTTWTIIVTTPQGMSCLVAAGEGWRNKAQLALEPEA